MEASEPEKTYLYRPGHGNETDIARLIEQHRAFVQVIKLFPATFQPRGDENVVDIGCGPGSWALDAAFEHPHLQIVGLDIDERAIAYAMARAKIVHAENVSFEVHDATVGPLPFGDESIDYITLSLANSFLLKEHWPLLLKECQRILRPGGWLRSVEWLVTQSSSLAMHRLLRTFSVALEKDGRRYIELAPHLPSLLQQAGLVPSPIAVYTVNFSEDTPAHKAIAEDYYIGAHLAMPFNIKQGVASREELLQIISDMQREMMLPHFYGFVFLNECVARKPGGQTSTSAKS